MILRKAVEADLNAVLTLAQNIFEQEQQIPRTLTHIPAEKHPHWWCAEEDGTIVATLVAYVENDVWHMGRLTVAQELRGQGIAPRLIRFALEDLFEQGAEELHMEARTAVVRILETFGAEITGEAVPFYVGTITPLCLKKDRFSASNAF